MTAYSGCTGLNPVGFRSPDTPENLEPQITVLEPNEDLAISRGDSFVVRWTDNDPDDDAEISIDLVQVDGPRDFRVAGGLRENDTGADLFVINTEDIVLGTYYVRLTIEDEVNTPGVVFATQEDLGNRVQVKITENQVAIFFIKRAVLRFLFFPIQFFECSADFFGVSL